MRLRAVFSTLVAIVLSFAFSFFLSACVPSRADEGSQDIRFVIGVSQANLFEPWRVAMTREIKEESKRYPYLRLIVTDAADRSDQQINDINRMVAQGIDLLIISPVDAQALTPIVSRTHEKLPIIVLDRGVEGYDYTVYIGPDNMQIGTQAGRLVRTLLGSRGGQVLELQGRAGSPPAESRSRGFLAEIAGAGNIRVTDSLVADWLRDKAEDLLSTRLAGYPKIDAVFAQNDAMALGACRALDLANRSDTLIVGVDGLEGPSGGLELVRTGKLAATFICPTGGREAVSAAVDILLKEGGIPKKIILRSHLITKQNLEDAKNLGSVSRTRSGPIVLGFAQPGRESEWRFANIESIRASAKSAGIELHMSNAELDQEKQIAAIRGFIKSKVDVIAFSPLVEDGWDDVLSEAKAAGIPVICSDRTVRTRDESLVTTYIGADFVEEGRRAARWLVSNVHMNHMVRIAEISGTENSAPANGRRDGFSEIIGSATGFEIAEERSGNFQKSGGKQVMTDLLSASGNRFDIVYAHNDDMALGAIEAIENAGLVPGKDIIVISVDGVKDAFLAMIAGKLACTVECNPLLGPQLMKAVKDYAEGRALPLRIITEEGVYPADRARLALSGRKY